MEARHQDDVLGNRGDGAQAQSVGIREDDDRIETPGVGAQCRDQRLGIDALLNERLGRLIADRVRVPCVEGR